MRTIGIDLAVAAAHKALVEDAQGKALTPLLTFRTDWEEISALVARARVGAAADEPLRAVMEPTGMAWFPVAVALQQLGVLNYLVNARRVADLRKFYSRHSSSDRISARVLVRLPLVDAESLYPLELPSAAQLACKRGCKEFSRLDDECTAIKNRLRDTDRFAWPGLETIFCDIFDPLVRFFRQTWYDPAAVVSAGATVLRASFETVTGPAQDLSWVEPLHALAGRVVRLYGDTALDYLRLQAEATRQQQTLAGLEQQAQQLWQETIWPLYRQLHPSRNVETLYGVGEGSAPVYVSFLGRAARFPDQAHFRGWHGLVPNSRQSGTAESKGLRICKAGPDLVKKYGYLSADVARRYDPQIAQVYYDHMVHKGNHHTQAVCACTTHLLDRIRVVLRDDRPYVLRDVDGTAVTPEQARAIIAERYTVPQDVRKRNNRRARQQQVEQRAEQHYQRRQKKRSRPSQ